MPPTRRGAATADLKLWLACGFAGLAIAAVAWQAWPSGRSKPKSDGPNLLAATPTDESGNIVETNYRPARSSSQRKSVLADLGSEVQTLAASIPAASLKGPVDGLASSTEAVLATLLDVSEESINDMFAAMGGSTTDDEGNPNDNSMLVKFIKGMFAEGELDLSRMVVRPKPDEEPMDNTGGPRRVSRDASEREAATGGGPSENRRVSAIRLIGPYDGLGAIAEKQRPIEVRVPYKPRDGEGERVLALDLLYNPGSQTWQMAEMRFEQLMVEDDG
ncbi:MAG: hypothetical protein ACI89L_001477 [Phycisphaerales bacterium]|jgi:hypothetical protein